MCMRASTRGCVCPCACARAHMCMQAYVHAGVRARAYLFLCLYLLSLSLLSLSMLGNCCVGVISVAIDNLPNLQNPVCCSVLHALICLLSNV